MNQFDTEYLINIETAHLQHHSRSASEKSLFTPEKHKRKSSEDQIKTTETERLKSHQSVKTL